MEAAKSHPKVIEPGEPIVIFSDFGDSALIFKIIFTIDDGFERFLIQSDIRFEIDRLFRKNNITIPFPQRDVHMYTSIDKKE